jgi:hypothetical protein
VGVPNALEDALFGRTAGLIQRVRPELLARLEVLDDDALQDLARKWAAVMSSPRHTHTLGGMKVSSGWTAECARGTVEAILRLARQRDGSQAMYLLIET